MVRVVNDPVERRKAAHRRISDPHYPSSPAHDFLHGGNGVGDIAVSMAMKFFVKRGKAGFSRVHTHEPRIFRYSELVDLASAPIPVGR